MSPLIPTHNRGIVKQSTGSAVVSDIPVPKLRDGYMLVKTAAVALNPADWTDIDHDGGYQGCVVGLDYAGTVVAVATGSERRQTFNKGDRVCGSAHGCNSAHREDGAFAEYIIVKADLQMHMPDNMSFEEAATLGSGIYSVGQGLYQNLGLPLPTLDGKVEDKGKWILIYGGSSATGALAIQFAKVSGYKVVTTCSPRNFELVRGLGADVVLDYRDPDCCTKIRATTSESLLHIFDTIATTETAALCANSVATVAIARALAPPGVPEAGTTVATAVYACTLDPLLPSTPGLASITKKPFLAYTAFGEAFWFEGEDFAANKEDYDFAVMFTGLVEELLGQRKIKTHPVRQGVGLEGVLEGLSEMRRGAVSGQKLVYRL